MLTLKLYRQGSITKIVEAVEINIHDAATEDSIRGIEVETVAGEQMKFYVAKDESKPGTWGGALIECTLEFGPGQAKFITRPKLVKGGL